MATVIVKFKNGSDKTYKYARYNTYKGKLYIWGMGNAKGKKPIASFSLDEVSTWKSYKS